MMSGVNLSVGQVAWDVDEHRLRVKECRMKGTMNESGGVRQVGRGEADNVASHMFKDGRNEIMSTLA